MGELYQRIPQVGWNPSDEGRFYSKIDRMNIKGCGIIHIQLNDVLSQLTSALFRNTWNIQGAYFTSSVMGYPQTYVVLTDGLPQFLLSPDSRTIFLKDLLQIPYISRITVRPFILTSDSEFRLAIAEIIHPVSYDMKTAIKDYFLLSFNHYQSTIINYLSQQCLLKSESAQDELFNSPVDITTDKGVHQSPDPSSYRSYLVRIVTSIIDLLLTDESFAKSLQNKLYASENVSQIWEILIDLINTGDIKYDLLATVASRYNIILPKLKYDRVITLRISDHVEPSPLSRLRRFTEGLLKHDTDSIINLTELIDITNELTGSHIKPDKIISYQAILSLTPEYKTISLTPTKIIPSHGFHLEHLTLDELKSLAHKLDEVSGFDELQSQVSHRLASLSKAI